MGYRTEVLVLQPWKGTWGLGQLPEASGPSHLLIHASASHTYCHCLRHCDPVLSPQCAPSHSQSNAYFLSLFPLLEFGFSGLGREGSCSCREGEKFALSPPQPSSSLLIPVPVHRLPCSREAGDGSCPGRGPAT